MAWYYNFIGMFVEMLTMWSFLYLLSDSYQLKITHTLGAILFITCVDTMQYCFWGAYEGTFLIGLVCIFGCLKLLSNRSWGNLIPEFFAAYIATAFLEFSVVWISHRLLDDGELSDNQWVVTGVLLFLAVYYFSHHPRVRLSVQAFYNKKKAILNLIFSNLFIISAMEIYLYYNKNEVFFREVGLIAIVLVMWVILNLFLFKEMNGNERKDELLRMHGSYINSIEELLDELHQEKHEYRKHLQTIEGLC